MITNNLVKCIPLSGIKTSTNILIVLKIRINIKWLLINIEEGH